MPGQVPPREASRAADVACPLQQAFEWVRAMLHARSAGAWQQPEPH